MVEQVFKAYDVRGVVPDQLDRPLARLIGRAFAAELGGPGLSPGVAVGHDMRESSPGLADALADGVQDAGVAVLWIGLASTDEVYFASGSLGTPAVVVTASHNPAEYNGMKFCRAGAVPVGSATGLDEMRRRCQRWAAEPPADEPRRGARADRDVLLDYAGFLQALAPVHGRRLRVVVDAGNGMAGLTAPAVLRSLDVDVVPLFFELDGSFPHHPPDPLQADNLRDLSTEVVRVQADVGLAFDGDADRCFVVAEDGTPVSSAALGTIIATRMLERSPGASVVHNLIIGRALAESVVANGGVPVRTPVGHSVIKRMMADADAVFGAEHSGHFYFRDFWYADSGMLAALHLLGALAEESRPLSAVVAEADPYVASGEVNISVPDVGGVLAAVRQAFTTRDEATLDTLDGLTVSAASWRFNLRPSNTEPLLRLNVEADSPAEMAEVRDFVLSMVRRLT